MKVFLNRSGDPNGSQYWLYDKLEYNIVSNSDKLDNSQFIYLSDISDIKILHNMNMHLHLELIIVKYKK